MVRWPCANGVYLGVGILQVWPRVHQVLPRAQNRRRVRPWHTFPLRFISIVCTCSHYFPLSVSISVHISCICQFRYIKNSSSRLLVMFSFILPYVCSAKYIFTCEPIPVLRRILSSVTTHTVQFRMIRHHVTFFIFPTNLQKSLKSRQNCCRCQPKSAVTRDRRIIRNCTVMLRKTLEIICWIGDLLT